MFSVREFHVDNILYAMEDILGCVAWSSLCIDITAIIPIWTQN